LISISLFEVSEGLEVHSCLHSSRCSGL